MVAIFSSGIRISGPGITGLLSLNFLFILFGIVELTQSETIVLGTMVTLIQCYWQKRRPHRASSSIQRGPGSGSRITIAVCVDLQVSNSSRSTSVRPL